MTASRTATTPTSTFIACLVAAALGAAACGKSAPADGDPGQAAGVGAGKQGALLVWKRLASYEGSYLKTWKGALADPDPSARDVLDAWNELGFAITGPGGFWRKTVPSQWFGCDSDPGTLVCKALADASAGELKAWDAFQADIGKVGEGQETAFLQKNQTKMIGYIDTYVPSAPNMTEMRATPFFKGKLEKTLGVTATTNDDL